MQITGITTSEFERVVRIVSASYAGNLETVDVHAISNSGTRIRGRVKVRDSRGVGARTSWNGRRIPAACWHAYRDVLAELFNLYPNAIVRTSLETYRGRAGFLAQYPDTAHANIGSSVRPVTMPELCDCSSDEYVPVAPYAVDDTTPTVDPTHDECPECGDILEYCPEWQARHRVPSYQPVSFDEFHWTPTDEPCPI